MGSWSYVMHGHEDGRIAELIASDLTIGSPQDILDIMGDLGSQEVDELIVHDASMAPAFFELRTGLAGEILQKCSNYGFRLALVGDFSCHKSESLQAFMRESNRGRHVYFVGSVTEALAKLSQGRRVR